MQGRALGGAPHRHRTIQRSASVPNVIHFLLYLIWPAVPAGMSAVGRPHQRQSLPALALVGSLQGRDRDHCDWRPSGNFKEGVDDPKDEACGS